MCLARRTVGAEAHGTEEAIVFPEDAYRPTFLLMTFVISPTGTVGTVQTDTLGRSISCRQELALAGTHSAG